MPMGKAAVRGAPRSVRGGRSDRYEARREARGTQRSWAPSWSDATASAVMQMLEDASEMATGSKELKRQKVTGVLASARGTRLLVSCASTVLVPADKALVATIVQHHHNLVAKCCAEGDHAAALKRTKAFLKPLYARKRARAEIKPLRVPPAPTGPNSFHEWLGPGVQGEKLRDISKSERILGGLVTWPLDWLETHGVVCYERAYGRIVRERPEADGMPDAEFTRGLVKTSYLPTAVANTADHYTVIDPGGAAVRFMRTSEVARAFMIPAESALTPVLLGQARLGERGAKALTAPQAVSCLGRCVHTGVARQLVALLRGRGSLPARPRYGSAFSGVDTFAAAVEAEYAREFDYVFASEKERRPRDALRRAWGRYGLTAEHTYDDACGPEATTAPEVDLWVCTPTCESYSKRNHNRTVKAQNLSLGKVWKSLQYVVNRRPAVVVIENVTEVGATGPMSGLLARLEGYAVEAGELDPRTTAHAPIARERYFWVLTRTDL